VLLGQVDPQQFLYDGAEPYAGKTQQASGELRIENSIGIQAYLAKAGQILTCGVQDPFLVPDFVGKLVESDNRRWVEEKYPGTPTVELDQVGALRERESGCTLGVDRDGPLALGNESDGL